MEIQQRLAAFFRRLQSASPAASAEEALALVGRSLEETEDELCKVPREEPPPLRFTGRMYSPRADRVRRLAKGTLVADTRHHRIFCQPDGSITIFHMRARGELIFTKPGRKL